MKLNVHAAGVDGAHAPLLLPTSLTATSGEVTLVAGDPGYGHVALALAIGGRLQTSAGRITWGGSPDPALRRRHVALVDVPGVTEPEDGIRVSAVIGEQLALARQRARGADVTAFLRRHEARHRAGERWESLPSDLRTGWLVELTALRPESVRSSSPVQTASEGTPHRWWSAAASLADRGLAVVVQCTHASARQLGRPVHFELGVSR